MIFINTKNLVDDLAKDRVNDREALKYFIGSTVLLTFMLYYSILMGAQLNFLYVIEFIVVSLISIQGILEAYKANGGDQGKKFIIKSVCLLFPIGIKLNVLSIAVGWVFYFSFPVIFGYEGEVFSDPGKIYEFYIMLHSALFAFLLYWRLKVNIKLTVCGENS